MGVQSGIVIIVLLASSVCTSSGFCSFNFISLSHAKLQYMYTYMYVCVCASLISPLQCRALQRQISHNTALRNKLTHDLQTANDCMQDLQVMFMLVCSGRGRLHVCLCGGPFISTLTQFLPGLFSVCVLE